MKRKLPVLFTFLAVILILCIAVALLWQPITTVLMPEVTLAAAVAKAAAKVSQKLDSPLTACVSSCVSYVRRGSLDAVLTLDNRLLDSTYRLTTASDPENRQQHSSFRVTVLGMSTEVNTYLDGDCAAFSMDLVTGSSYYGITFDTYAADLEDTSFYSNLNSETITALNSLVAKLDGVYTDDTASRSAAPELPDMEAPDWARTLVAYVSELEFSAKDSLLSLDGVATECTAITTQMDSQYAASMFLDALQTVSSNIWLASSLYSNDETEDTPAIQEMLEYYRDNTEGTVTMVAYIYDGTLVGLDLEWNFTANHGDMDINDTEKLVLNLGADPAKSDWNLTLKQAKGNSITASEYCFGCSSSGYFLNEVRTENEATCQNSLTLQWDSETGGLQLQLTKSDENGVSTATAVGSLLHTDTGVSLEMSGLYGILAQTILPDFLKSAELSLVEDITLEAVFSAGTAITKPEYINLDQWELPFLLDLFL